jgi:uncharacterized DUF497 family protein
LTRVAASRRDRSESPSGRYPADALRRFREERWLTLGQDENGKLLVVSHTFEEVNANEARVRVISAREATASEREQYESGN